MKWDPDLGKLVHSVKPCSRCRESSMPVVKDGHTCSLQCIHCGHVTAGRLTIDGAIDEWDREPYRFCSRKILEGRFSGGPCYLPDLHEGACGRDLLRSWE